MEWLGSLWTAATQAVGGEEGSTGRWLLLGAGAAVVVGGGAAAYMYYQRDVAVQREGRALATQLDGPGAQRGHQEAVVEAAPSNQVAPGAARPAVPAAPAPANTGAGAEEVVVVPAPAAPPSRHSQLLFAVMLIVLVVVAWLARLVLAPAAAVEGGGSTDTALVASSAAALALALSTSTTSKSAAPTPLAPAPAKAEPSKDDPASPPAPAGAAAGEEPAPASAPAASGAGGGADPTPAGEGAVAAALAEADALHEKFDLGSEEGALGRALAAARAEGDVQGEAGVLWRQGRLANSRGWRMAMDAGGPDAESSAAKEARLGVLRQGHAALLRSLELHEPCAAAHKWAAVVTAQVSPDLKSQITTAFVIRDHGRRAVELEPGDVQARYILGAWAYTVAGVGWFERSVAAAIFGSGPPEATYEEALEHFQAAEQAAPGFWMVNRLKLAQTHAKLGNAAEARRWLAAARELPHTPDQDRWGAVELRKLGAQLGV